MQKILFYLLIFSIIKPDSYRSANAFIDEAYAWIAGQLGITAMRFLVLSGDAVPYIFNKLMQNRTIENAFIKSSYGDSRV